jgi:hypothetical protein
MYRGRKRTEVAPHLYAIADNAYSNMLRGEYLIVNNCAYWEDDTRHMEGKDMSLILLAWWNVTKGISVSGSTAVHSERSNERNLIRAEEKEKTFTVWSLSPSLMHTKRSK